LSVTIILRAFDELGVKTKQLLRKAKQLMDEETMPILSLGLCLVMVVLATQVGFFSNSKKTDIGCLKQNLRNKLIEHKAYIGMNGEGIP